MFKKWITAAWTREMMFGLEENEQVINAPAQQAMANQPPLPEVYSNVIQTNFNPNEFELTFGG